MTATTSVLLDPNVPAGMQAQSRLVETLYERYMPEMSELANRVFRDRVAVLKARIAQAVSIWTPGHAEDGSLAIPRDALVSASGTAVPGSDVNPEISIPVRTPQIDPRTKDFSGNLDLVSVYLAQVLAKHVVEESERVRAKLGKPVQVWHGDVEVIAELPYDLLDTFVNGMKLSKSCPLVYARLFVYMRMK